MRRERLICIDRDFYIVVSNISAFKFFTQDGEECVLIMMNNGNRYLAQMSKEKFFDLLDDGWNE